MNAYIIKALLTLWDGDTIDATLDVVADNERDAFAAAEGYSFPDALVPVVKVQAWSSEYKGEVPCDEDDHTAEVLGCTYRPSGVFAY
jgi:hypothetical protein